tara:strand:+ start:425 stop:988 length:564 start_codon:yes stop_codon:yes gene_type:complete
MRIISGGLKGRSIGFLKNSNTRPLKDTVKENIFNILEHSNLIEARIENSNILDLYSGIGSFGIECISRGATKVTFVEKDKDAVNILKDNLIKLSIVEKSKLHHNSIENILSRNFNEKFHVFFFDPPFKNIEYIQILAFIKNNELFEKKNIVIIHRENKSNEEFDQLLNVIEIKHYGRSKIIFGTLTK